MEILTQEQAFLKGESKLESLIDLVKQSATRRRAINEVEEDLWQGLLAIGKELLQGFVDIHGSGDLGPTLEYDGRTRKRLPTLHSRRYVSVFGPLKITRTIYGTRETQKHEIVPLDAQLNLPDGDFSYLLQSWDQALCVQSSYSKSKETIRNILGVGQSVRGLEHMSRSMQGSVGPFRDSYVPPPAKEEGSILVVTADGKGVPMRRKEDQEAPQGRLKKGEKASKKRSACVGVVYTVDQFARTADDVVDEVMRKKKAKQRPRPCHKQMRAELTREIDGQEVKGKELTFGWFEEQIKLRNPDGAKPVVCLMDGERALQKRWKLHLQGATCILDLYHVMERIWDAGHCLFPEGSKEAAAFVTKTLRGLLSGNVGRVIGGIKQMATKRELKGGRKHRLQKALQYLDNNRQFMKYDEYLRAGYPIGSGVVEGACRHLVKDRMELTGMRWTTGGAQAVLDLRAIYINGDWEDFQALRIKAESNRLYPYCKDISLNLRAAG